MKKSIFIPWLFTIGFLHAQRMPPITVMQDSSSVILKVNEYEQLWKNHFQNSVTENKVLFQTHSTNLSACAPNHLPGLFCKMEYKIETKSKLAPRFRLGSLNYTNWMEGKGTLYNRYLN